MRIRLAAALCLLALSSFASAAQLSLKILDSQGAVVPRARVAVYRAGSTAPLDLAPSAATGTASFDVEPGTYRVEVLAAGFAARSVNVTVPQHDPTVVELRPVATPETVEVSAALTPVATDDSTAAVSILTAPELLTMQPTTAAEALRFAPGAVVNASGRRGGLASLFVRGGESRYNKVIIDGVSVNDPGGTFDLGVITMEEIERVEFVRGAASTLYGSDAMTSALQFFTRTGSTPTPELRFGAEGGSFSTARGFASVSGARGPFDFNIFGQQFDTEGQSVNDDYFNASQGANIGLKVTDRTSLRVRARHSNSRTGVQSFWKFNGNPLIDPDTDQFARQNNFLASAEFTIASPSKWQHRITGFEYNHKRQNVDRFQDPGRTTPLFGNFDFPFDDFANINRAGAEYQAEYTPRSWARSIFGYQFEVENGFVGDRTLPPLSHGLRRNHSVFGEEVLNWKRVSVVGGARFIHNESFGNRTVPRVGASVVVLKGGEIFSGTRLRFAYAQGIKEPRLEESFGVGGFGIIPNPDLRAESNRSFEAGFQQNLLSGKMWLGGTYYNNLFSDQIAFKFNPATFEGQYINVNESLAHGAEIEWHAQATSNISLQASYVYTSTQILSTPPCTPFCDPLLAQGAPLLRRPKHSGSLLVSYSRPRFGAQLGGTFVGRRADSDFLGLEPPVTYAAGYGRFDVGAWRAITPRVSAFANVENVLNRHYDEVAGYPGLRRNFRAGMRFRIGGE